MISNNILTVSKETFPNNVTENNKNSSIHIAFHNLVSIKKLTHIFILIL